MKKPELNITIKLITSKDSKFLFQLLSKRKINESISHKKMPNFSQHLKFISSKPYSKWYIIFHQNKKIGSIYLSKQNEIGLFLIDIKSENEIRWIAIKLLMQKNPRHRYLANINPKNKKMSNFYKKNSFNLIQHTYELDFED